MKIKWKSISIKELAAIVSDKLNESGIDAILVGGACVSIYTKNKYLSSDLDFVSSTSISVKDRLAAYYHWNDPQALEQALLLARSQKISLREIKRWSEKEGQKEKYNAFANMLKRGK